MSLKYLDIINRLILQILNDQRHISVNLDKNIENAKEIDETAVQNILHQQYTNWDSLSSLQSAFDIIFYSQTNDTSKSIREIPYLNHSITNLFKSLHLASSVKSQEGYALLASFKSIKDLVVIKTTKEEDFNILYEYFIGVMGINELRKDIPNFSYTLSIFKCNPLTITDGKKINIDKFCVNEGGKSRHYIVYENIIGQTLHQYLLKEFSGKTKPDINSLLTYLISIIASLAVAQDRIDFVHYDLHDQNIILRDITNPITIDYIIDDEKYSITVDKIPTMIDYGFSHFVYQDIPYGVKYMPSIGVYSTKTSTCYDMYKIILTILHVVIFMEEKK